MPMRDNIEYDMRHDQRHSYNNFLNWWDINGRNSNRYTKKGVNPNV